MSLRRVLCWVLLPCLVSLAIPRDVLADVRLSGLFSDHCVLQREMPIRIWGWAEAGEQVVVKLGGRQRKATTGEDGRWRVELPSMKAGGPHVLLVRGKNTVRVKDVLIGEVWLCSGQSNMSWSVARSADGAREVRAARDGKIRHFQVPHRASGSPRDDVEATWTVCSPKTAGAYTACGYFMARELRESLRVPVGLLHASWGGTRIEPWTAPDEVEAQAGKEPASHQEPGVLFHGMIHALVGFPLRGAIWYQGEANRRDGALYTEKKKALIGGWRRLWGLGDFPFYYAQIAPFRYGVEAPGILPTFWEAQAAVLEAVPNTGMVVTNDLATLDDIHPPHKQDVGRRLAWLALHRTYGKKVVDTGPTFQSMRIEGSVVRVTFENTCGTLRARDREPLTCFEIAGADTGFVPADAKIVGGDVLLSSSDVPEPVAMRFAWHKLAEPNLVNGAGLPAGAFRAGQVPRSDFLAGIDDAKGYRLLLDLDLDRLSASPQYDVDARPTWEAPFDRIAYLLELRPEGDQARYLWVSMKAFTDDPSRLGIPTLASGIQFQQPVSDMTVVSNVEGVVGGQGLEGNVEFWPCNYGTHNGALVPHASDDIYDFGDSPSAKQDGYGSMQVHHPVARQTLFAINGWRRGGQGADIGIGNSPLDPKRTDWTFAANGGTYLHKRLRVFVRPGP